MRRRNSEDSTVGEDSFLDTTANLVGILIILVVVIGTKTKLEAEAYGRQMAESDPTPRLEEPARAAQALAVSLQQQAVKQQEYELETAYRRAERDQLLASVQLAREAVDVHLASLNQDRRIVLQQTQEIEKLESELQRIAELAGTDETRERPKIVLEHLPTPMAQTVFNREMHVQLKAGQVTVIPWDRLVSLLKEQVPLAARRQASRNALEETLGPVGGFMMRYRMFAVPGGFELDRFELETTAEAPTESMGQALSPAGRLRLELASRNPAETVVTVWVYPDSFEEFRQLKSRLFEEGFLCAARPLPEDVRIGASPRGSRSSAQ